MKSIYMLLVFCSIFGCNRCKKSEECTSNIVVTNQADNPKVIWMTFLYPDTNYYCNFQKKFLSELSSADYNLGQGACYEQELESIPLQVFVIDSTVFADSGCEVIKNHSELYQRYIFSKAQLENFDWQINITE
jgi:hypothetical protein